MTSQRSTDGLQWPSVSPPGPTATSPPTRPSRRAPSPTAKAATSRCRVPSNAIVRGRVTDRVVEVRLHAMEPLVVRLGQLTRAPAADMDGCGWPDPPGRPARRSSAWPSVTGVDQSARRCAVRRRCAIRFEEATGDQRSVGGLTHTHGGSAPARRRSVVSSVASSRSAKATYSPSTTRMRPRRSSARRNNCSSSGCTCGADCPRRSARSRSTRAARPPGRAARWPRRPRRAGDRGRRPVRRRTGRAPSWPPIVPRRRRPAPRRICRRVGISVRSGSGMRWCPHPGPVATDVPGLSGPDDDMASPTAAHGGHAAGAKGATATTTTIATAGATACSHRHARCDCWPRHPRGWDGAGRTGPAGFGSKVIMGVSWRRGGGGDASHMGTIVKKPT